VQAEVMPLAKRNAKELNQIHRKAQATAGGEQRERIQQAAFARAQQRQQRLRQLQQQAAQAPRAPKRKKGDHHGRDHHGQQSANAGSTADAMQVDAMGAVTGADGGGHASAAGPPPADPMQM
jgi:hypothetical protein